MIDKLFTFLTCETYVNTIRSFYNPRYDIPNKGCIIKTPQLYTCMIPYVRITNTTYRKMINLIKVEYLNL